LTIAITLLVGSDGFGVTSVRSGITCATSA
jgi:hypothetical protein